MATKYIAHAVYGVTLHNTDCHIITNLLSSLLEDDDLLEDLLKQDIISHHYDLENLLAYELDRNESCEGWLQQLCKKYNAPLIAEPIYTGDYDDRPGRCATDAECWILGIPLLTFPIDGIPAAFKEKAMWFTWVECG